VLKQRGITFKSKEQARELAETFASSIRGGTMANA
jgi:hypothetical protein